MDDGYCGGEVIHAGLVTFWLYIYSAFQASLFPRSAHWTEECSALEICRYKMRRVDKNDIRINE